MKTWQIKELLEKRIEELYDMLSKIKDFEGRYYELEREFILGLIETNETIYKFFK